MSAVARTTFCAVYWGIHRIGWHHVFVRECQVDDVGMGLAIGSQVLCLKTGVESTVMKWGTFGGMGWDPSEKYRTKILVQQGSGFTVHNVHAFITWDS